MANYVKAVNASGVYERFDLHQEFQPGVNILYGKNGAGKTTLLHILSNILNGDFRRFAFFRFDSIAVRLDDGTIIQLKRYKDESDPTISVSINDKMVGSFQVRETQRQLMESEQRHREYPTSRRETESEQTQSLLPTAYFPAFRTMIEAWTSVSEDVDSTRIRYETATDWDLAPRYRRSNPHLAATQFARALFEQFVPDINYPSPIEIEYRLRDEVQKALLEIGATDGELLSQAFLSIFAALSKQTQQPQETSDEILEQIKSLSERLEDAPLPAESFGSARVYTDLLKLVQSFQVREATKDVAVPILDVYRQSLEKRIRAQKESFQVIDRYLASVNEFLEGKQLVIREATPSNRRSTVGIKFSDGTLSRLSALSSGERQIVTLIYSSTHMSAQKTVLIDEPEISLHVDWQRRLLRKMCEQLQDRQIIACTHSPVIGADYESRMFELKLQQPSKPIQLPLSENAPDEDGDLGQ